MKSNSVYNLFRFGATLYVIFFAVSCTVSPLGEEIGDLIEQQSTSSNSNNEFITKNLWMFHAGNSDARIKMSNASSLSNWTIDDKIANSYADYFGVCSYIFNGQVFVMYGDKTSNVIKLKSAASPTSWTEHPDPFGTYKNAGGLNIQAFGNQLIAYFSRFNNCYRPGGYVQHCDVQYYVSTSTDGVNWSNPIKQQSWSVEGCFDNCSIPKMFSPSMTEFNNKLYVFRVNSNLNLIEFGTSTDGTSWSYSPWGIGGLGSFLYNVESVTVNNKIYLFFVRSNKIYQINSTDGENWSSRVEVPNPNGITEGPIGAMVYGNYLVISYKGANSNDVVVRYSSDGINWSSKIKFQNNKSRSPISLLNTSGLSTQ